MISFHPSDVKLLDRIAPFLKARGFAVWHADPNVSDMHNDRLKGKAVIDTKVFVLIVSQASLSHAPCKDEAALAYISGKPMIPLGVQAYQELEPYLDSAMKMMLAKLNWTFFINEEDWDKRLTEMADSVWIVLPNQEEEDLESGEFEVEYKSMTEARQRLFITLRRSQSVQQSDLLAGPFEALDSTQRDSTPLDSIQLDSIQLQPKPLDFWDKHFPESDSLPFADFMNEFIKAYGQRIQKHIDSVGAIRQQLQQHHQHQSTEDLLHHLLRKEFFHDAPTVERLVYDKICDQFNRSALPATSQADVFYNRVKEYIIGKLAMLKVFNMDSSVRLVAIQNLGTYQTPEIVSGLLQLLTDSDPNIRTVATLALGRCDSSPDVESIVEKLCRSCADADRLVRQAACISLGHLRAAGAVKMLVDIWRNDPISDVRGAALAALERMEGDDAKLAINMTIKLSKEMQRLAQSNPPIPTIQ